jgi:hypothetical protein
MPKEDRELMISGIHPKCWIEMFEDFDKDEEEDNGDSETQGEEYGEQ